MHLCLNAPVATHQLPSHSVLTPLSQFTNRMLIILHFRSEFAIFI